jgi:hypothetical protein
MHRSGSSRQDMWNVHYRRGRLAGVIDFGLAHLDSRPWELAVARTYRAPEAIGIGDGHRGDDPGL